MELILKTIKSLFRKTEKDIEEAKALANKSNSNIFVFEMVDNVDSYSTKITRTELEAAVKKSKVVIGRAARVDGFVSLFYLQYYRFVENYVLLFACSSDRIIFEPNESGGYDIMSSGV